MNMIGENKLTDIIPEGIKTALGHISKSCAYLGFEAFIVGGAVRDMLLGSGITDVDISVVGDVQRLAAELRKRYGYKAIFHPFFGTVTLQTQQAINIDITTARRETYSAPAALPEVFPSNLYDDLRRRDFTINSMAVSLEGFVFIDPFGGREDLKNGILRVLHDNSFTDDPTRIMRGIRFEKRYGFKMDNRTEALMRGAIAEGYPARLSSERVLAEMEYMMAEPGLSDMLGRMEEIGLWCTLFGGSVISPLAYQRLGRLNGDPGGRLLFPALVLMEDINDDAFKKAFGRYKTYYEKLETYRSREKALKFPVRERPLEPGMLYRLFWGIAGEILEYLALTADTTQYRENVKTYMKDLVGFKFYINGGDLESLGIKPGPRYRIFLERARVEIVEGNIKDRRGQLEILAAVAKRG